MGGLELFGDGDDGDNDGDDNDGDHVDDDVDTMSISVDFWLKSDHVRA